MSARQAIHLIMQTFRNVTNWFPNLVPKEVLSQGFLEWLAQQNSSLRWPVLDSLGESHLPCISLICHSMEVARFWTTRAGIKNNVCKYLWMRILKFQLLLAWLCWTCSYLHRRNSVQNRHKFRAVCPHDIPQIFSIFGVLMAYLSPTPFESLFLLRRVLKDFKFDLIRFFGRLSKGLIDIENWSIWPDTMQSMQKLPSPFIFTESILLGLKIQITPWRKDT